MILLARYLPRFRKAAAQVRGPLAEREVWPREAIERFQLERLNRLWAGAVVNVPHYARMAATLKLPSAFATLDEFRECVPILTKRKIRSLGRDLLSGAAAHGRWHRTSGSTGKPLSIFWSGAEYRAALASTYRFYASHGVQLFEPVAFLLGGDPLAAGPVGRLRLAQQYVSDTMRNRIRFFAHRLGPAELRGHLRRIDRFGAVMLYGFSRAIYLLAREAIRSGVHLPSIRLVVPTSEVATPPVIETIQRAFRAPVAMEYGATECPLIAGQDAAGSWRVREDEVLLETIPRTDGRFNVVLTVLGNTAFPLLRYAIEDIVDRPLEKQAAGFACLGPVSGRDDELLVSGRGVPVHPTVVDAVLEVEPAVRRYRMTQRAQGAVVVEVELDAPLTDARVEALALRLSAALEQPVRISIVEAITVTSCGKHRLIHSEVVAAPVEP